MTAWIVDDDRSILALISAALAHVNIPSETFASVHDVMLKLDKMDPLPDLCIADWTMKEGGALAILEQMPSVRFVVMSGDPDVQHLLPEGVEWLEKPFRLALLHQMILQPNL